MNISFTKILFALTLVFVIVTSDCFSQTKPQREIDKFVQVYEAKVSYLTTVLELTKKESDNFWPLYNEYWKRHEVYSTKKRSCLNGINRHFNGIYKQNDEALKKLVDLATAFDKKKSDLEIEFYSNLRKFLPEAKVARLYKAEEDFRIMLINQLKSQSNQKAK